MIHYQPVLCHRCRWIGIHRLLERVLHFTAALSFLSYTGSVLIIINVFVFSVFLISLVCWILASSVFDEVKVFMIERLYYNHYSLRIGTVMVRAQTTISRDADFREEFMLKLFYVCDLVVVYPNQCGQPLRTFLWGWVGREQYLGSKGQIKGLTHTRQVFCWWAIAPSSALYSGILRCGSW